MPTTPCSPGRSSDTRSIEYRTVRAAEAHQEAGLRDAPHPEALRVRVVHRRDGNVRLTPQDWVSDAPCRQHIADDLAADIVRLLSSPAEVVDRDIGGVEGEASPVRPGHIAVLVAANRHAAVVRDALDAVGVPAVISGAGSVFGAPIARDWLALLEALERPTSPARVRAAALSVFIGWSAAAGRHRRRGGVGGRLRPRPRLGRAAADPWRGDAVRVADPHRTDAGAAARTPRRRAPPHRPPPHRPAAPSGGDRRAPRGHRTHVVAAAADRRRRRRHRRRGSQPAPRVRLGGRAGADRSTAARASSSRSSTARTCGSRATSTSGIRRSTTTPANGDRRTIDVGGPDGPAFDDHRRQHVAEERGEELRLAYVALTRARHQAVVWWASSFGSRRSSLARLLFAGQAGMGTGELARAPSEDDVLDRLGELAALAPGAIGDRALHRAATGAGGPRSRRPA